MAELAFDVVTVTLNPAIDLTGAIDNFTLGRVNRLQSTRSCPGGKGVNVAAALADFGHAVAATGFLGAGNSALFEKLFAEKKIRDCFVRLNGSTRSALKITDVLQHETTDINFPGLTPGHGDIRSLHESILSLNAACFVLAGSLCPGLPEDFYQSLTLDLKARGKKVVVDSSGEALRHAVEAAPDLIKPNIHELGILTGLSLPTTKDVIEAARSLLKKGIRQVVVSMGARGACFVSPHSVLMAVPPEISITSTVGAGDAMVAGLVSAQLAGLSPQDSARLATAFSLNALSHEGPGLTSKEDVRAFTSDIRITSFNN